jgi:hypothetical protein
MLVVASRCIVLWLALIATGAQAQVKAVIDAPGSVSRGDLVILSSARSNGTTFKWLLVNSKKTFFAADGGRTCLFSSGQPGDYIFVLIVAGADNNNKLEIAMIEHTVTVIGDTPTPTPDPEPTPNPTPPLVTTGKRAVVILRESSQDTTSFGILATRLRTGEESTYLKSKGHVLTILDDDSVTETGASSPTAQKWASELKGIKFPALGIADLASGVVYFRGELPSTAAGVIELVKKYGG